ncbi:MAG: TonB-dependent receptor [Gemmatimonas sp.]|nr:TonB-dependent receptor [Gemmatimonas sp.]
MLLVRDALVITAAMGLLAHVSPPLLHAQGARPAAPATAASQPARTGTIQGRVLDRETQQPVSEAQVQLVGSTAGALSDSEGRFTLAGAPVGTQAIRVLRIGYRPTTVSDLLINPGRPTQVEVQLETAAATLAATRVVAGNASFVAPRNAPASRITMSYEEIRRAPGAIGDVSRLVQAMPGVLTGNDTRNDIISRGGSPMENLFLVDGLEVPNLNHFAGQGSTGGPIGMLNNELVRDVAFFAGAFGPRYGNRLSSVLDISLREGNPDGRRTEFDMSNAGAGIVTEGPLGSRANYLLSGRQSYLDLVAPLIGLTAVPYTTNFQAKVTWRPGARDVVKLVGLGGFDRIDFKSTTEDADDPDPPGTTRFRGDRWTGGASWQRLLGARGVGTLVASASTNANDVRVREEFFGATPVFANDARENEYTLRYDATFNVPGFADVNVGASAKRLTINSEISSPFGVNNPFSASRVRVDTLAVDRADGVNIAGAYLELVRSFGAVDVAASVRGDRFAQSNASRLGPRAAITWRPASAFSVSGTWGRYHQQVPIVYTVNVPANAALSPMQADHSVLAARWTPRDNVLFSVEAFDRQYRDYPVARDYAQLSLANTGDQIGVQELLFPMTSDGTGRSRGLEFFAQQKFTGSTYGQVSYTRSQVEHRARDGQWRPGGYDAPNLFTAILGAKRGTKWEFSTRGSYSSGRPLTPLNATAASEQNRLVYDLQRFNGNRTPAYARLDVRIDRRFLVRGSWLSTYLDLQNITNRDNRSVQQWNSKTRAVEWREQIAFFPVIGINWKF